MRDVTPILQIILGLLPWAVLLLLWRVSPLMCVLIVLGGAIWLGCDLGWRCSPALAPIPAHQAPVSSDIETKVRTYFYPGLGASWMQALRYVGPAGLNGSSLPNAPLLLYSVLPLNPPEVIEFAFVYIWRSLLALPWIFTALVTRVGTALHGIVNPVTYFLNVPFTSFAQGHDQLQLPNALPRHGRQIVFAGSSRGASTVLCAVAQMSPEALAPVKLVVLEGAFDTVPNIARARFGPYLGPLITWVLTWTTRYDPGARTPLDWARRFPANVPVAFITSKADTVVPMEHTLALRDAVVAARNGDAVHVHALVLEKSEHSSYVNQDADDQKAYKQFMDDLHRKYIA